MVEFLVSQVGKLNSDFNLEIEYKQFVATCQQKKQQIVTMMEKSPFGTRLRIAFDNANNATIARKLGVSPQAVVNYMSGRIPDTEKLKTIKTVTNCDLDWLLTGDESRNVDDRIGIGSPKLTAKLRTIAAEQARVVFSDAEIAGTNLEGRTLELLVEYLVVRSLAQANLIDDERELMSSADHKRAQRFTFIANLPQSLDERIKEIVRREVLLSEGTRSELANVDDSVVISPLRSTDIMLAPVIAVVGDDEAEGKIRKTG